MEQPEAAPVRVKTMTVVPAGVAGVDRFSGTVEAETETSLSFPVMGTVKKIYVAQGDKVRRGALIAELDEASMQNSYMAAAAALRQAEDVFGRMKELHDKGSLAEIKWVEVQSKLQQAQSVEQIAKKNLDDCRLYAPYGGFVAAKSVEAGQNVMPGIPVASLVTVDGLRVKIAVPEAEIGGIGVGQEAEIVVQALEGRHFAGKVIEKGVVAHPLSRSYDVKIALKDDSRELMPGMVAEVVLKNEAAAPRYVVPARVLQLDEQNRSFVWLDSNGKATKRIVTCGAFTVDGVTIESGLEQGDRIIVEGQQKVCEGLDVKTIG